MNERYIIEIRRSDEDEREFGPWVANASLDKTEIFKGCYHMTPWDAARVAAEILRHRLEEKT